MSTKAIREVLEFWAESCPEAPAGIKAKAALAELEAIEKAGRVIDEHGVVMPLDGRSDSEADLDAAADLLAGLWRNGEPKP